VPLAWQNIPSSSASTSAPASAPVTSGGSSAPSDGGLLGSPLFMLVMFVPLIVMMLWSSRSQKKQQEKVLADIKKGDTILLQSGIRGKLSELGDRFAKVEIAPGTKIEVLKTSILGKDTAEAAAQLDKR
jgi:preprotein translocase subunit YajC